MSKDKLITSDLTFAEPVYADLRSRVCSAGVQVACAVAAVLGVTVLVAVLLLQDCHLKRQIVSLETRLQERNDQLLERVASLEALAKEWMLDVNSHMENVEVVLMVHQEEMDKQAVTGCLAETVETGTWHPRTAGAARSGWPEWSQGSRWS
uniref:Uncharacterized protein n=1 Tax=Branchiostoma floridae TaxID=7739 RepID=C3Z819_BRAFL|eukprot:XP_002595321.1 hypothetical protein BRAFLDRAFT_87558 [Branchiostoma floridae]